MSLQIKNYYTEHHKHGNYMLMKKLIYKEMGYSRHTDI